MQIDAPTPQLVAVGRSPASCHSNSGLTRLLTVDLPMQPLYGFGSKDPARFARAAGHQDLLYVHDSELSFEQVLHSTLM